MKFLSVLSYEWFAAHFLDCLSMGRYEKSFQNLNFIATETGIQVKILSKSRNDEIDFKK